MNREAGPRAVPSDPDRKLGEASLRAPIDDIEQLIRAKQGRTITVCIPARNEEGTLGIISDEIARVLMKPGRHGAALVDELIVVDDRSTDRTAAIAREAGASVIATADATPGSSGGKGNALWTGLQAATGDLLVFCDADLESFSFRYVTRLVAPLLLDPALAFVKGFYDRHEDATGAGGGRTTELSARPLLTLLFPELAFLRQPLSGEFAGRSDVLREVPFIEGYGVEVGLLVDILRLCGADAIAQVDLGLKLHRHRSLAELSVQATEIAAVLLERAGAWSPGPTGIVVNYGGDSPMAVPFGERPPIRTVLGFEPVRER